MSDENDKKPTTSRLIKRHEIIKPQDSEMLAKEKGEKADSQKEATQKKIKVVLKKKAEPTVPQEKKEASEPKQEAKPSVPTQEKKEEPKKSESEVLSNFKKPIINKNTEAMGLPPLKQSAESKPQGELNGEVKAEVKTEVKPEAKVEEKAENKEVKKEEPVKKEVPTEKDAESKAPEGNKEAQKPNAPSSPNTNANVNAGKPQNTQKAEQKKPQQEQKKQEKPVKKQNAQQNTNSNVPHAQSQAQKSQPQVNLDKKVQANKSKQDKNVALSASIRKSPIIIKNMDMPPLFKEKVQLKSTGPVGQMGGMGKRKDDKNSVPKGFVRSQARDRKMAFGKKKEGLPPPRTPRLGQVSSAFKNSSAFPSPDASKNMHRGKNYTPKKDAYQKEENREHDFEITRKSKSSSLDNVPKKIDIMSSITVGELARKMNLKASEIITKLFALGMMASINEQIDSDTATIIASEYGCDVHIVDLYEETVIEKEESKPENLVPRAPIVTVMGHVDHGKTKLLDAIRNSDVTSGEFGGITQHIGAYKIKLKQSGKELVFIDTPGHAAFTMMRARGAKVTDIVILVVAATEGVMPQTVEAIDHAKAANVPIVVALNKCDLENANPEKVMTQLSEYGLTPEEWGGNTQYCQISALKKEGIFELLEAVIVQAEILELKADPTVRAEGTVLEAKIDQGRGVVATVLVQEGTLHKDDTFVAGIYSGHVRAMLNDKGEKITEAGPSTPVEITGMDTVPSAGDPFQVTENEKIARTISTKRQELERQGEGKKFQRVTLDNVYDKIKESETAEFNVIIKGDVQGSVEALETALLKLSTPKVRLNVISARAGAIIENDVNLAIASNGGALIIGFNVRPTPKAAALAESEKIEIRKYNVIYDVVDDVKAAMEGLLSPVKKESQIGTLEVRDTFKVPNVGIVAGCMVTSGKIKRKTYLKVVRDNIQISNGLVRLSSLKRFKDDAKEVAEGFECGVGLENFQDIKVGDILEAYEIIEEKQHLDIPDERL